jgi:hypothetical protein
VALSRPSTHESNTLHTFIRSFLPLAGHRVSLSGFSVLASAPGVIEGIQNAYSGKCNASFLERLSC